MVDVPPTRQIIPGMKEDLLQDWVIKLAHLHGWHVAHFRVAWSREGWRTPVQADGAGFPDLIMLRGDRMVVVELKSQRGTVVVNQLVWLDKFREVPGVEVYVWRPRDWAAGTIQEVMR